MYEFFKVYSTDIVERVLFRTFGSLQGFSPSYFGNAIELLDTLQIATNISLH